MKKITTPYSTIIETTAGQLATTFYEIGRSQGLKSKHKNARVYARANIEKFIPKAIEYLIEMLSNPNFDEKAKEQIYIALMERTNDPETSMLIDKKLPDIDVKKLIDATPIPAEIINTKKKSVIEV